jgi:hypothetical protein
MTELLHVVASWPSLFLVVIVFGFAPGFCLRLIALAYPRSDPRRKELTAELYAVPRIQRPLWVAEQLEVALFEGLPHRVSAVIRSRANRASTAELLSRMRKRERAAWDEMVHRYGTVVTTTVRSFRLQDPDALDAVQMTWLRLAENLDRIKFPERLDGWLATTARRECLQILRRGDRDKGERQS